MANWTAAEDAAIRADWVAGLSTAAIASRHGRTKNSVVGRLHRLGVTGRDSPIRRDPNAAPKPPKPPRVPRVTLPALGGAALPDVVLPATRRTAGGREVPPGSRHGSRDAVAGPTLSTTPRSVPVAPVSPHRRCQFIAADYAGQALLPDRYDGLFCGAATEPGYSYCAHHKARCFSPMQWRLAA